MWLHTPQSQPAVATAFPPETGTLLSASQTFPLEGELPFRGANFSSLKGRGDREAVGGYNASLALLRFPKSLAGLVTPHSVGRCRQSRQRGRPPSAAPSDFDRYASSAQTSLIVFSQVKKAHRFVVLPLPQKALLSGDPNKSCCIRRRRRFGDDALNICPSGQI